MLGKREIKKLDFVNCMHNNDLDKESKVGVG